MKTLPGVVTTLGSLNSGREFHRARAKDVVKKKIRDIINNALIANMGADPGKHLNTMVASGLHALVHQNIIRDFNVDSVEVTAHKPFREVDCLPITAKPGDPLIVDHVNEEGDLVEVHRGVIISADGEGKGIIFSQPCGLDKEGQVLVRCSIRPTAVLESIVIEVKQEY